MKRLLSIFLISILAMSLCGCFLFEATSTSNKIPTFFSDSEIVSVRYYYHESEGYRIEELDEDRLDEFIDELNAMELKSGGARDYFWGGSFGVEMTLEDGTYLTYDGTRLELLDRPIDDPKSDDIKGEFVYVTNCEFWDVMRNYFPSINENGDKFKG